MTSTTLNAEHLYQVLLNGMRDVQAHSAHPIRLVGVASGGVWLAQRLQHDLGLEGDIGVISSSMHRDDFAQRGLSSTPAQTQLPFEVNDAHVWLIDDVLYTGRTLRAVLNELFDFGRPHSVKLAVLVERKGYKQLPVCADLVAGQADLPPEQSLELALNADNALVFDVQDVGAVKG
ncbi:MAG: bifunctional pyr operon transcriptional regulator/uracil phosphoribosyltransferase PyrR [Burkholderiaceae bacterium]|jgi:pyrimidine operon attenuation protein / uracil phosphoribosyltransferase|nr:bifunctional pyr operon transcriptional regulator/uracil phosphoribosyltransferase PyrR [Burkholderiaceae bacterium]